MTTAEIIAIGNELLIGHTLDTNTNWLCRQITGLGGQVRRAVMVQDDLDAIARELHDALGRETDVIVTTGGTGPTADDRTLEAIAGALGRPLAKNDEALRMVERRYNEFYERGLVDQPGLTDARRKMGRLPQGAQPIFNPVGGAPAVRLDVNDTTIITLPGVPQELKGIWQGPLQPTLTELFGQGAYLERTITTDCPDDSVLAPLLAQVVRRHPDVYIKSHVKPFGTAKQQIRVTFSMAGDTHEAVEAGIDNAMQDFEETLRKAGFEVRPGEQ
ncbi:MAG: competence/damage-inducible protein A [Anaerolineae bacterium]